MNCNQSQHSNKIPSDQLVGIVCKIKLKKFEIKILTQK